MDRHYKQIERSIRVPSDLKEKLQSANSLLEICEILAEYLKYFIAITDTTNQIFLQSSQMLESVSIFKSA